VLNWLCEQVGLTPSLLAGAPAGDLTDEAA
jgi:hypothetical protein